MDHHKHTDGRRSLLKKVAVVGGAVWVAPVIASQPAAAQQGSAPFSITLSAEVTDLPLAPCSTTLTTNGVDNGDGTVTGTAMLSDAGARILDITAVGATVLDQQPPAGTALPGQTVVMTFDGFPSTVTIYWECVP